MIRWRGQRAICFNSRSRVGSDILRLAQPDGWAVSIRAPAWGATGIAQRPHLTERFQFALPRGERPTRRAKSARC